MLMIEVTLRDIAEKFELNILTIHHIITKNRIFPEDAANLRSVLFTRSTYCAINYSGHQFTGRYANSASPPPIHFISSTTGFRFVSFSEFETTWTEIFGPN